MQIRCLLVTLLAAAALVSLGTGSASALAWQNETVDSTGTTVGLYTSLALDGDGNPRISYFYHYSGYDLKFALRDSAGWHAEWVDSEGMTGFDSSLALDGTGNPRISYLDGTNHDLKYAWRDGAVWGIETVDSDGKVGASPSLALNGDGDPRIRLLRYFECRPEVRVAQRFELADRNGGLGGGCRVVHVPGAVWRRHTPHQRTTT